MRGCFKSGGGCKKAHKAYERLPETSPDFYLHRHDTNHGQTTCMIFNFHHKANNGTNLKLEHKNLKSKKMYLEMLNVWDFLLSNLKDFVEKSDALRRT